MRQRTVGLILAIVGLILVTVIGIVHGEQIGLAAIAGIPLGVGFAMILTDR